MANQQKAKKFCTQYDGYPIEDDLKKIFAPRGGKVFHFMIPGRKTSPVIKLFVIHEGNIRDITEAAAYVLDASVNTDTRAVVTDWTTAEPGARLIAQLARHLYDDQRALVPARM